VGHIVLRALRGNPCQCLFGLVGSACRAQALDEQPVRLQQRPRPTLMLEPLHPSPGTFASQDGLIGGEPAYFGLLTQLGRDLTEAAVGEGIFVRRLWRDRQPESCPFVVHMGAQPGKAEGDHRH